MEEKNDLLINTLQNNDTISEQLISIADQIVQSYSAVLDNLMQRIYQAVVTTQDVSDQTLENYFLELSSTLYFVGEQVEHLGISTDVAEAQFKEKFNTAYLNYAAERDDKGKSLRTVNENTALATEQSKCESVVNDLQTRAFDLLKYKITAAQTMVGTLSKMLSKKISDASLTMASSKGTAE